MQKQQPVYIATWEEEGEEPYQLRSDTCKSREEAGDSDWWFDEKDRVFKRYWSSHDEFYGNQYTFDEVLAHMQTIEEYNEDSVRGVDYTERESSQIEIVKSILSGMIGIGGVPSNEEFYEEFDMRVKADLGVNDWINASERMPEPEQLVLAAFVNEHGKGQIIRAVFAPRFTVEDDNEYDAAEYNEEKDEYFLKEGWYERNEFEQINWSVEAEITHWKPLPKHPAL